MTATESDGTVIGGVWAIVDTDHGDNITMVYRTEIDALRVLNTRGFGRVRFVAWGYDLNDMDQVEQDGQN